MSDLKVQMEKGAISADMVTDAFKTATSEGGRFYNAMDAQSKTFAGLMSTLKDNVNNTLGTAIKPLFDYLTVTAMPKAIELTNKFSEAITKGGLVGVLNQIFPPEFIINVQGFIKVFTDLYANTMPSVAKSMNEISKNVMPLFIAVFKLIRDDIIPKMAVAFQTWIPKIYSILKDLSDFVTLTVMPIWPQLKTIIIDVWSIISTTISVIINTIQSVIKIALGIIKGDWSTVWTEIKSIVTNVFGGIKIVIMAACDAIFSILNIAWTALSTLATNQFTAIKTGILNIWNELSVGTSNAFTAMLTPIKNSLNMGIDLINGFVNKVNGIRINIPAVNIPGVGTVGGGSVGFSIPNIPKLAKGTNQVPRDMLAMVHKGEAVVPKEYNNSGSRGLVVNVTGNSFSNKRDIDYTLDAMVKRLRLAGVTL